MSDVVVVWSVQTLRIQLNLSNYTMKKSHQLGKSIKILMTKYRKLIRVSVTITLAFETYKQLCYFAIGSFHHPKAYSSLMWINCTIFVKTALIDEVCNKPRQLAKGNMAGLGIGGYCEKIGKNRNLTGLVLYFYLIPQILVKYEFYFCFCWVSDGVTDFDYIQKFVVMKMMECYSLRHRLRGHNFSFTRSLF